jgi:hypothetical protein
MGDVRIEAQIAPLEDRQRWVVLKNNLNILVVSQG